MMKLSERIREYERHGDPNLWLREVRDEVEQLEEQKDDLLNKLVAGEELYISRGMEIVQLEKKNKSLMKLAGMYIKSYEDLAFANATNDAWIYCDVCDDVIKPEEMDERHSVGIGDYHAECCPQCAKATADELTDE